MRKILNEVIATRQSVASGDMDGAKKKLTSALRLIETNLSGGGPRGFLRSVQGYLEDVGYAVTVSDARWALSGLEKAERALQARC